jgi:hypothetical protein
LSIDDAFDCDELISRLVGPLSPPDRIAFRRVVEEGFRPSGTVLGRGCHVPGGYRLAADILQCVTSVT